MKLLTPNMLKFAMVAMLLTLSFKFFLSDLLSRQAFSYTVPLAICYFIAMFASGWVFGKKDYQYLPLLDFSFRIHFITFVIFNVIAHAWFLLGLQSTYESLQSAHFTALIWGTILVIHFVIYSAASKSSIKGLDKSDLFE